MNKQQFIDYLRDPTTLASNQLDELESIVTDYPYFQSARTLLAKGHKQTKSTRTNKLIASAAVHVPDRKMLKKYINGRLFFIHPQEEVQPEDTTNFVSSPSQEVAEKPLTKPASEPLEIPSSPKTDEVHVEKPVTEPTQTDQEDTSLVTLPTEGPTDIDALIAEIYQDIADLKVSKARFKAMEQKLEEDEAVENALSKASQKSIPTPQKTTQKVTKTDPEISETSTTKVSSKTKTPKKAVTKKSVSDIEKKETKKKPAKIKKADSTSSPKSTKTKKKVVPKAKAKSTIKKKEESKVAPVTSVAAESKSSSKTSKDFQEKKASISTKKASVTKIENELPSDSEKSNQKSIETTEKPSAAVVADRTSEQPTSKNIESKEEKATPLDENTESTKGLADSKVDYQSKDSTKGLDQKRIIADFIDKDPKMPKAQKTDKPADDLAEKSARFKADVASEYLAEIYIGQGKKQRAIEIYENLSLKFPQKQSYFAGLIKKLKK